jgi:hypothetical protein
MIMKTLVAAALAAGLAPTVAVAGCAPAGAQAQAVQAVVDMFAAAKVDDLDGFHRVVAPGFYAYDSGKRYDGDALFEMVKAAHAKGLMAEWSVTDPKVAIACDGALVTYVNRGALGDAKAMHPMTWLESAWLRYQDGRWRLAFFHSTRAEAP